MIAVLNSANIAPPIPPPPKKVEQLIGDIKSLTEAISKDVTTVDIPIHMKVILDRSQLDAVFDPEMTGLKFSFDAIQKGGFELDKPTLFGAGIFDKPDPSIRTEFEKMDRLATETFTNLRKAMPQDLWEQLFGDVAPLAAELKKIDITLGNLARSAEGVSVIKMPEWKAPPSLLTIEETLERLKTKHGELSEAAKEWNRQISTVFTDFSRSLADTIIEFRSWKDLMLDTLKDFARMGLRILIEGFMNPLEDAMTKGAGGGGKGGGWWGWLIKGIGIGASFIPGVGPIAGAAIGVGASAGSSAIGSMSGPGVMNLASGGIITKRSSGITEAGQLFNIAERGPEIVLPLKKFEELVKQPNIVTLSMPDMLSAPEIAIPKSEALSIPNITLPQPEALSIPEITLSKSEALPVPNITLPKSGALSAGMSSQSTTGKEGGESTLDILKAILNSTEQSAAQLRSWKAGSGDTLVLEAIRNPDVRKDVGQAILSNPNAGF